MNLKILYENPILKMMSFLVFFDSFILLFVGLGIKGGAGIELGLIYGILGGLVAMIAFNLISALFIAALTNKA
ncbi:hypothetical protein CUJ83_03820 [Methanocella sp. CWC-04]|uniref:Uncharacterized protein n=1 Tax=Methanooceanicella nereidis TaxID=2052831 RepID=A0AAP2RAS3_9EURY|nr:hypothetical protein [Methanocella sp. CWC-04]MCD1294121.1 hypothetical protein [Methanocella sp. CWC-04]